MGLKAALETELLNNELERYGWKCSDLILGTSVALFGETERYHHRCMKIKEIVLLLVYVPYSLEITQVIKRLNYWLNNQEIVVNLLVYARAFLLSKHPRPEAHPDSFLESKFACS
jgi:hypothetical protein